MFLLIFKILIVLGFLAIGLKATKKWWSPLLGKVRTDPNENYFITLWTWLHDPNKQDRRTAVGMVIVILMGLAMPLSRTVVWSSLSLIIIAGIAFWGVGLFAEDKVKKGRHASFNNILSNLVWVVFAINFVLYGLQAYGVNPETVIEGLREWKTTQTSNSDRHPPEDKKEFVIMVPATGWSPSFEEVRGKAPEKAISNCTSWKLSTDTGEVVRYTNPSGSKTGEVDSTPGRGPGPLLWSDLPSLRFQSASGKEVTVKLTLRYD